MGPGMRVLSLMVLAAVSSLPAEAEQEPKAAIPSPGAPIDLLVETVRVTESGTETLYSDEARILPGQGAVVERDITLEGLTRSKVPGKEKLHLRAEVRLVSVASSRASLQLSSRLRVLASSSGEPLPQSEVTRKLSADLGEGASQLLEVYESTALGAKVTLNVRWVPAEPDPVETAASLPIPLTVRIHDADRETGSLLSENRLLARLAGSASTSFNRTVPLPDTGGGERRVRQESLEITLSPQFQGGRVLEVLIEATGVIATLEPESRIAHPISHRGRYLLSPGLPATLDLEVGGDPTGSEGWNRVRYRLEILASF